MRLRNPATQSSAPSSPRGVRVHGRRPEVKSASSDASRQVIAELGEAVARALLTLGAGVEPVEEGAPLGQNDLRSAGVRRELDRHQRH